MSVVKAGQHPIPLDDLHAQMSHEDLRRHLGIDHQQPIPRSRGAAAAQRAHQHAHEQEGTADA